MVVGCGNSGVGLSMCIVGIHELTRKRKILPRMPVSKLGRYMQV